MARNMRESGIHSQAHVMVVGIRFGATVVFMKDIGKEIRLTEEEG